MNILDRFAKKIRKDPVTGCWQWIAGKDRDGYGYFHIGGRRRIVKAHRFAYQLFKGKIEAPTLDHRCRNRACVNPNHLQPMSQRENVLKGETLAADNIRKTHCINGHPYDESNTYHAPNGQRMCRDCHRVSNREWARKQAVRKQMLKDLGIEQ